jgi:hypothetical protein
MTMPSAIAAFRLRCESLAVLVRNDEMDAAEAAKRLQTAAEAYGIEQLGGQDAVQQTIAEALNGGAAQFSNGFDEAAFYETCDEARAKHERAAREPSTNTDDAALHLEDFVAYLPKHNYVFLATREPWPATSVNARIAPIPVNFDDDTGEEKFISAAAWLDQNRPVEQMTWCPGLPMLIEDKLVAEGGWIERTGCTILNLYRPPILKLGSAQLATPWLEHVHRIYPNEAGHIVKWLAHRVQRPQEKINHALVLGGAQGIGKDTLLEPVKRAVGAWNTFEISPQHLLGRFNGFAKSVILRVNEARDLGEMNRYQLYDHLKSYTATPPDVLRVDEKNLREHSVFNVCGVIITTNHKADGIYLPADDRRHFVAWSDLTKDDFEETYWNEIWQWYDSGGDGHVAAYLAQLDISGFNPKAPPPKTAAFWAIVDANRASEDAELADALDLLGNPDAVTIDRIKSVAAPDFVLWLKDRKNRRAIPHRFEQCGYTPVRNDARDTGLWVIDGVRLVIYAKIALSVRDRLAAAAKLTRSQQ